MVTQRAEEAAEFIGYELGLLMSNEVAATPWRVPVAQIGKESLGQVTSDPS